MENELRMIFHVKVSWCSTVRIFDEIFSLYGKSVPNLTSKRVILKQMCFSKNSSSENSLELIPESWLILSI